MRTWGRARAPPGPPKFSRTESGRSAIGDAHPLALDAISDEATSTPTDRAGRALGGNGRHGAASEVHELFDFFDARGALVPPPLFLDYSSGWRDASTFSVTVLNGTYGAPPGLLYPYYAAADTAAVDGGASAALKPGVAVVLEG